MKNNSLNPNEDFLRRAFQKDGSSGGNQSKPLPRQQDLNIGLKFRDIHNPERIETVDHTERDGDNYFFVFESGLKYSTIEIGKHLEEAKDLNKDHIMSQPPPMGGVELNKIAQNDEEIKQKVEEGVKKEPTPAIKNNEEETNLKLEEEVTPNKPKITNKNSIDPSKPSDLIQELFKHANFKKQKINLTVDLNLPTKEQYKTLKDTFGIDFEDALIDSLFSDIKNLKECIKDGIKKKYSTKPKTKN